MIDTSIRLEREITSRKKVFREREERERERERERESGNERDLTMMNRRKETIFVLESVFFPFHV